MAKVLLLPVGMGIAHVGRLIMVARKLKLSGVDVVFGAGSDAVALLKRDNLPFLPVAEFERKIYDEKVKKNNFFIYTAATIKSFIRSELDLYKKVKPDIVVFDLRLTARVSAQIVGIPTVSVTNADISGYYDYSKVKFPTQTLFGRYLPRRVISLLEKHYSQKFLKQLTPHLMQGVFALGMLRYSAILIKLGYKFSTDPFQLLLGDLTLIADAPEYHPVKLLPRNVKIVGPIFWDAGNQLPESAKALIKERDVIYVTASGTGDKTTFIKILKYLSYSNYAVVATTGNTLTPKR